MKKIGFTFLLLIIMYEMPSCTVPNTEKYIAIPQARTVIGNDKFCFEKESSFTGVAGEEAKLGKIYLRKEHVVILTKYNIKKHLITNSEYLEFMENTSYHPLQERYNKESFRENMELSDEAVTGITLFDAVAYCQWLSEKTGKLHRLPTNAEWEYAAIANTGNMFPWGNTNKFLAETKIKIPLTRKSMSIYQVTEDTSKFGMSNLMGGVEYTLDCYDEEFYDKSPKVNPVCLIPNNADCVMRGIDDYNDLKNHNLLDFGLYAMRWNSIDDYNGYSYFRTVRDEGTIFNKGTVDESVYSPQIARAKSKKVRIYPHASESTNFSEYRCFSDLYILFESPSKLFYRCFVQTREEDIFGDTVKIWKTGWIAKEDLDILPKKWYEATP